MPDALNIIDFLDPLNLHELSDDENYKDGQIGKMIDVFDSELPELHKADIILVGCDEERGMGLRKKTVNSPDAIRYEFYQLYYWHPELKLADIGNIKTGASLSDTYAALKVVITELVRLGKMVIILGGSHDLTLPQYYAYVEQGLVIEAACIDAKVDLSIEKPLPAENFLMEMLTGEPNFIRHYKHIGFQSYLVHPHIMETMDKLRFDCYRLGAVKENIDEMEPVIRNCHLVSFDISAIAHAFAPSNLVSPNGFDGEQACVLMRYAGLSPTVNTIGIYGYSADNDPDHLTAKQISHMLWYILDGRHKGLREAALNDRDYFFEYNTFFSEVQTTFLQSKKTGRWWMQLPDLDFIACSYKDYMMASSNEIPERWLRAQERS